MTFPWERKKLTPAELAEDENGIPYFLKRTKPQPPTEWAPIDWRERENACS